MDRTLTAMSHSPLIGYMGGSVAGRNHYHHLRGSQESDSESSSSLEFDKLLQLPHTHTHWKIWFTVTVIPYLAR